MLDNYRFAATGRLASDFKSVIASLQDDRLCCDVFDSEEELAGKISNYNALAAFGVGEKINLSGIQWIHSFGAGVDSFTHRNDLHPELILTRTTGNMGQRMAEYCLAYILNDLKAIDQTKANQERNAWKPQPLIDLYTQKVLVMGTGSIGSAIAQVLSPLAQSLTCVNRTGQFSNYPTSKMSELTDIKSFNIIINTLPLTGQTTGLYNADFFVQCKEALFINVGRGESVVEEALVDALNNGNIRSSVLDVFQEEPLPPSNGLWSHSGVIVTPHHASKTNKKDLENSFSQVLSDLRKGTQASSLFVDLQQGY